MAEQTLSVLTFNTLGIPFVTTHQKRNYFSISKNLLARFRYIAEALRHSDADVIMLQEVHLYSLLSYLKKKLHTHPYCYYQRFLYGPKGGLVIFSKYELVMQPFFNYSVRGSLKNKTFVSRIIRNGALICTAKNLPFMFINTYITGNFSHKWHEENKYTTIQKKQVDELLQACLDLLKEQKDIVLGGDFNIHSNTPLLEKLVGDLTLTDFFKTYTTPTHHPEFLPKWVEPPRLDHLFSTQNYTSLTNIETQELFTEKVILGKKKLSYLSDHIALLVKFYYE